MLKYRRCFISGILIFALCGLCVSSISAKRLFPDKFYDSEEEEQTITEFKDEINEDSEWYYVKGDWAIMSDGTASDGMMIIRLFQTDAAQEGIAVQKGLIFPADYTFSAKIRIDGYEQTGLTCGAGLMLFYQDNLTDYIWVAIGKSGGKGKVIIEESLGDQVTEKSKDYPVAAGKMYNLKVVVQNGTINCYVNKDLAMKATYQQSIYSFGKPGLRTLGAEAAFDNVSIIAN